MVNFHHFQLLWYYTQSFFSTIFSYISYFSTFIHPQMTLVRIGGKVFYSIPFYYDGKKYKIHLKKPSGVKNLRLTSDSMNRLEMFLGPFSDFFGQGYTPEMLGVNGLTFYDDDYDVTEMKPSNYF